MRKLQILKSRYNNEKSQFSHIFYLDTLTSYIPFAAYFQNKEANIKKGFWILPTP